MTNRQHHRNPRVSCQTKQKTSSQSSVNSNFMLRRIKMSNCTTGQSMDHSSQGHFFQAGHPWDQEHFQFGSVSTGESFDISVDAGSVAGQCVDVSYPSHIRTESAVSSNENTWGPLASRGSGRGRAVSASRIGGHLSSTQEPSRMHTVFPEASSNYDLPEDSFAFSENPDCLFAQAQAQADANESGHPSLFDTPSSRASEDPLRPLYNVNMWHPAPLSTASETETICSPIYQYDTSLLNPYSELSGAMSFWSPGATQSIDTLSSISEAPSMSSLQPSISNIDSEKMTSPFSPPQTDFVTPAFGQTDFLAIQPSSRRSSFAHARGVSIEGSILGSPSQPLYEDFSEPKPMLSPRGVLQRPQAARFPRLVSVKPRPALPVSRNAARSVQNSISQQEVHEESEIVPARDDPLYQAMPQSDGLYHCPFEGQDGCVHKPAKLKCNYDKYVDSHLRPYRCKVTACLESRFSSTACLLRHEREAHGMHGHGEKPHLCSYEGCDRSIPGNGFPRRWNLYDHMKRVHDYKGPSSTASTSPAASPSSGHASSAQVQTTRKRKSASSVDVNMVKRPRSVASTDSCPSTPAMTASTITPQSQQLRHLKQLEDQWAQQISSLQGQLKDLQDPLDISGHEFIRTQMASLHDLATAIQRMSPQQSTIDIERYDRG